MAHMMKKKINCNYCKYLNNILTFVKYWFFNKKAQLKTTITEIVAFHNKIFTGMPLLQILSRYLYAV